MYLVKYGTECLHDVRTDNCQLLSLTLDGESNACDHCEFEIATNHPMYDKLKERDLSSPVCVYDGEEMIFSGFIYEIGEEFNRTKTIKCKGELAYLGDTVVRPYSTLKGEYGEIVPNYLSGYFEWLIDQHNLQVDVSKQFVVGYNEGSMLYSGLVYKSSVEYPTTSTEIKEQILDSFGGYLRIRRENGIRYIDLLSEYTDVNEQLIDFGVNILDYAKTDDSLDVYTAIVPLGANMSETDYYYSDGYFLTKDKTPSSIKTYYSQSTYERCSDIETFESGVKYFELLTRDTYTRTADTTPSTFKTYYTKGSMSEQSKLLYFTYGIEYYEKNGDFYYRTPDLTPNYRKSYYTQSWSSNTGVAEWEANTVYYELSSYQWYSETKDSKPIYGKTYYTMAVYSTSKTEEEGLTAFANDKTYYEFDESLNQSDKPLTLSMIADWKVTDDLYHTGDYIFSKENVAAHGLRVFSSKNTDIITVGDLLMWGTKELNSVLSPITTIEIKAIDLSLVDKNYKGIRVGQYVRVRSKPHGFDSYMLCDSIDLDLVNPENTTYTFGMSYDTFTGQQNKKISALNSTINKEYQNAAIISQETKKTAQDALSISKDANNNASSANAKIDNLEVGGRNLLLHSSDMPSYWYTVDASGASQIGTVEYQNDGSVLVTNSDSNTRFHYKSMISVQSGETYTISCEYKEVSGDQPHQYQIGLYTLNETSVSWIANKGTKTSIANGWIKTFHTFTIPSDVDHIIIYFRSGNDFALYTHEYYIRHPKLEKGNKATDWTPAPEDVGNAIDDAAKTATNYMEFTEGTGLVVGDMTSDTLGKNSLIDSDGVAIRDGTTEIARFGANKIELGKNNDSSKTSISLLNGYGHIDATTVNITDVGEYKYLDIYAEKISMASQTAANNIDGYIPSIIITPDIASLRSRGAYVSANADGSVSIEAWSINFKTSSTSLTKNSNYCIYGGRVLYSNSSGSTGTITLNETANNFSMIEIFYGKDGQGCDSTKIFLPNGKTASLTVTNMYSTTGIQTATKLVTISGTSVTPNTSRCGYANLDGSFFKTDAENIIKIRYVFGYK